ncbi:CAP domain-containing protein [Dietzia aurantiaca]|uniref:CAP domain-containing protein n=1 Tax=Dietzia aurantiaca TaxID=983873 RepID=UPI001E528EEA|nr:CAP domain-containing protein [Dietzia aurantiaca]MCD2262725.1 CAP domain-containing protein [Dietzia aurantiaca]
MRHPIRSAVVAGTSALLLAMGAGTAAAQSSFGPTAPLSVDLAGIAALFGLAPAPTAPGDPAPEEQAGHLAAIPDEINQKAFAGTVVAGINEARTAVGADRLTTSPALETGALDRAGELAAGDTATGDLPVPDAVSTTDRTTLALPAQATPPNVLTALLADTGMRERMLDGGFTQVGAGTATAADGSIHVVLDFA